MQGLVYARSVWSAGHSPAFTRRCTYESGGMPRTPNASRDSDELGLLQPNFQRDKLEHP
jgi:hypothetical protein